MLEKLDEFIRKYYKNQLIRGLLYSTGIVLAFYLAVAILEYYGQFDTTVRSILFYLFILTNGYVLAKLIAIPIMKLYKMGKIISNEQASEIIGKYFSNVQDKLLNVLQLQSQSSILPSFQSSILIEASINQKIKELKPIPFTSAIDLRQNKKYLKYALVPLLLFFAILFGAPSIIKDSTERLLNHGTYFEKQAPFQFLIQNKDLKTPQQEDFLLEVQLDGKEIPDEIFVNLNGSEYKLTKENKTEFSFLFKNVQKNIPFHFSAEGFSSKNYELVALPKPILLDFSLRLNYPKYIGKKDETLHNTGDLMIPAGTKVTWNFNTQNAKQMKLGFQDTIFFVAPTEENKFTASQIFLKDKTYSISTSNEFLQNRDSVTYSVNVIPDIFPAIMVEERKDSVSLKQFYYAGNIKDDYGFRNLTFNYKFLVHNDSSSHLLSALLHLTSIPIPIAKNVTTQSFYHFWDMTSLNISPGDEIEYYFEVWDNDGVNGSKSSKSQSMIYRAPSLNEIEKNTEKNNSDIKKEMEQSIKDAQYLQKEMQDLYKKILEKKNLSWEEKKKLDDLLKKQKELEDKINEIKKENQQNNQQQSEFQKPNDEILDKQKQLEKLMETVMTDEMKKMFLEMQKLMEKMDKNKIQEMLEKMQLSNKDIEKELDRNLEIFKKMEFEQKFEKTLDKLNELSKKQDELGDKSLDKKADDKELKKQQDSLNKQFDDIKKDLEDLKKKNDALENPENMPDTKEKQEEISKDQQNSSKELNDGKSKSASKSQKSASQKMNQMAQQMGEAMAQMQQEQEGEDEQALRDILNNLIQLSFDQEALMKDVEKIKTDNPQYVKLSQQQKKLKDDAKMIEDSLFALSKRQPMIASAVNKEISAINSNMEKSISLMGKRENRFTPDITSRQQFSMTSINNLALMLNESLNQMQNNCKKSGACTKPGSCKKPGHGKKPSAGSMSKMQEQLKKQMEALKKSMEQGKQQGGQQGNSNWSQELVRIAAQQEALKQMMQQMQKEGGMNPGDMKNMLKMMEESQKDVVNRILNEETLKRQDQILEKLLDYEKAEKERETEKKRQAEQPKDDYKRNLSQFMEYKIHKEKETELLKTVPPSFNKFYKNKVSEYFNNFANEKE
ncbi:MAG: DUF4175 domain-containing protein [Bacteroidetes bacterium]|nr:DUF4175 domain-containing protein [Bacteroidota bacterium]